MRFLMTFKIPHETFNRLVRDGVAGERLGRVVQETRPEQIYFTEQDGKRAGVAIYDIKDGSTFCSVAEPWFLAFGAECRFSIAMTPDELGKTDLVALGRAWS